MLGKLSLDRIIWVTFPAMILTPLYTYYMAVSKGEEPPYPHATVTSTAQHYPQSTVFRFVMLFCSSLIALIFYCTFRWLENEAKKTEYKPPQKWMFYLAQFSILCYGITIGTIDGHGGGSLHGPCAVIFFVIWFTTIINLSVYMHKLRQWDSSVMSKLSLTLKMLLAFYIAAIWTYCIYGAIVIQGQKQSKGSDEYVVILEWNSVMVNLFWVLSLVVEWKKFKLCLISHKKF